MTRFIPIHTKSWTRSSRNKTIFLERLIRWIRCLTPTKQRLGSRMNRFSIRPRGFTKRPTWVDSRTSTKISTFHKTKFPKIWINVSKSKFSKTILRTKTSFWTTTCKPARTCVLVRKWTTWINGRTSRCNSPSTILPSSPRIQVPTVRRRALTRNNR